MILVKVKIQVEDWDTGESIELILPCDLRNKLDTTHDLYIVDWEGDLAIGYCDDITELNNILDDINAECPSITLEMIEAILAASSCSDLSNEDFIKKICSSDFMFEEIIGVSGDTNEEKCARYLTTKMMIPFAKNITDTKLEEICSQPDKVTWERVWKHYSVMGFKIITIGEKIYAFHWGNTIEK